MAGENPEDTRTGRSDEFLSKSKWERLQVLIMGPVMNIALALVLTAVVAYQGVEKGAYEDQPPVVGVVTPDSVAARSDIKVGDRIVSVSGRPVSTWANFLNAVSTKPDREIEIGLLRNGLEETRRVTPAVVRQSRFEFGDIGVLPDVHPFVRSVQPAAPPRKAGMKTGDVVLE
jgi:regulator of sigma E protease